MMDMAMITQWSDAYAGWDLTISGGTEGIFNVDAHYTEYRDASGLIYGHDVVMSMDTDNTIFFDLEGHLEADDGDKVMPLDIHMSMGVDYSVNNAESQVLTLNQVLCTKNCLLLKAEMCIGKLVKMMMMTTRMMSTPMIITG